MTALTREISEREKALGRYFRTPPVPPTHRDARRYGFLGGALTFASLIFWVAASNGFSALVIGGTLGIAGLSFGVKGAVMFLRDKYAYEKALVDVYPQPTDEAVDQWMIDGLARLKPHSLDRLSLTLEECDSVDVPPIRAPVPRPKRGLVPEDTVWRVGNDGKARFGVYDTSYLWFTERHLAIFRCDYDFIRDVTANEETFEFYYQDIVSVATRETSSSVTLRTGDKLTLSREFRIAVANDQYFLITFNVAELKQLTGAETIPESGSEKAVRAVRKMLQERKNRLLAT